MKQKILWLTTLCLSAFASYAQRPKVDLNTIFVCVDSTTYATLFTNPFVKDTLFFCKAQQTQTTTETYNGKYAIGKSATLEFFRPIKSTSLGDKFGDLGIEFKTRKLNDLQTYISTAKKNKLAYRIDTAKLEQEGKPLNWYREFMLQSQVNPTFGISILEYQQAYLLSLGFTKEEINTSMTYAQYNTILSDGRKYPRKFNSINYISLSLNEKELIELKKMAKLLGLVQKGLSFSNTDLTIDYQIKKSANFKLRTIGLKLTENVGTRNLILSEKLKLSTQADQAYLFFKY